MKVCKLPGAISPRVKVSYIIELLHHIYLLCLNNPPRKFRAADRDGEMFDMGLTAPGEAIEIGFGVLGAAENI